MKEIEIKVREVVKRIIGSDDDLNINLSENIDSLSLVTIVVELENEFNIEIPDSFLIQENFVSINSMSLMVKMAINPNDKL